MERQVTPPHRPNVRPNARSPPTPEVTRRIEENRLKAKAIRERRIAEEAASQSVSSKISAATASLKRNHSSISSSENPTTGRDLSTNRDARDAHDVILPARKFKKYVDHDFSKMTDTKGGFLNADDDPFNKAMHASNEKDEKPAHMTLKEWERHQLLKSLRRRKEGPFEPGLGLGAREVGKKCADCGSLEIDWTWDEVFNVQVCSRCKDKNEQKYSLLTKTECKTDYMLTEPELADTDLLPRLLKPNPHKAHWHDMSLFLRFQVEEYAIKTKWGSAEAMDAEFERRQAGKEVQRDKKFKKGLAELEKKTRGESILRRKREKNKKAQFGDRIDDGKHVHTFGIGVEGEDGATIRTCTECGHEIEEFIM